ncbi:hypothetical protein D3C84_499650 [compost metagenome]
MQPRRVVGRRLGAGHQRAIGLVAVTHDVVGLVVLPVQEGVVDRGDIEVRVVGGVHQLLDIGALVFEHLLVGFKLLFTGMPFLTIGGPLCLVG